MSLSPQNRQTRQRAYIAVVLSVGLCAIMALALLAACPTFSGRYSTVLPGPSAPSENIPGPPLLHPLPKPEYRPFPSPGPW